MENDDVYKLCKIIRISSHLFLVVYAREMDKQTSGEIVQRL